MTVTTTANSISYAGNGATTAFAFPYIFFAPSDLIVTQFDSATGAALSPPPYTVSGVVTNGEYASGGTVTFNSAPAGGTTVSIVRAVPATQTVTLIDNTKFPATTINTEFDKLTVLSQQAVSFANHSALHVPAGDVVTVEAPMIPARANRYATWDGGGNFTVSAKTVTEVEGAVDLLVGGIGIIPIDEGISVPTLGALQALTVRPDFVLSKGYSAEGDQGGGMWDWVPGNLTAQVTADPGHGLWAPPATDLTGASGAWQRMFSGSVSPLWFGAKGDGTTNDLVALRRSLESGSVVDGGNRIYAVNGSTQPATFVGLQNITIKQLDRNGGTKTLMLVEQSNFYLRHVKVDMNYPTLGSMADTFGIIVQGTAPSQCQVFTLDDVEIFHGGASTGLSLWDCRDFLLDNVRVRDFVYPGVAVDDVVQGIWFNLCHGFSVTACRTERLTNTSEVPAETRGFVIGGCYEWAFTNCIAEVVAQGFDFTGTSGNKDGVLTNCLAMDCHSVGLKFANSAHDIVVSNCEAIRCGFFGFTVSGMSEVINPNVENISFVNCRAINPGSNGVWVPTHDIRGFDVQWNNDVMMDRSYPRNITFTNCEAIDNQATKTMDYGFMNVVAAIAGPAAGFNLPSTNRLINCKSVGHLVAWQTGFHFPAVRAGNAGIAVPNGAFTPVQWVNMTDGTLGFHDTSALRHSTAIHAFTIKETGYYDMSASATFDESAIGQRGVKMQRNGVDLTPVVFVNAVAGLPSSVVIVHLAVFLNAGTTVEVHVYQNIGGPLGLQNNQAVISLNKVQ